MFEQAYRYKFAGRVDLEDAQDTLLLAILAAEGLVGEARVMMDSAYATDSSIGVIVVDASTITGRIINAIFTSFIVWEFGPQSFDVKRVVALSEAQR